MTQHTPIQSQGGGFSALGISPKLLQILERLKFKIPTPIQHHSIPAGLEGKDIIGIAQTGTGKTLAYGLPLIEFLSTQKGQGLILVPTRELALQVDESLRSVGNPLGIKTAVLIGGQAMRPQLDSLRRQPRLIIATPGRLLDHMESHHLNLMAVRFLVLDEADRMLDMGFAPQINQILKSVPKQRQTFLFSATMPSSIVKIATTHMQLPVRVEVAPAGTAADKIQQEAIIVGREFKLPLLESILEKNESSVLVFSRTKQGAKRICGALRQGGYKAAEIHANRSLAQRREALDGFKSGRYRILVATDIAARGIDVSHIETVVNFDLPDNTEDYVHRIGRTGRAGRSGKAISFVTPDQRKDVKHIERLIRKTLTIIPLPQLKPSATPLHFGPEKRNSDFQKRKRGQGKKHSDKPFEKSFWGSKNKSSRKGPGGGFSHSKKQDGGHKGKGHGGGRSHEHRGSGGHANKTSKRRDGNLNRDR